MDLGSDRSGKRTNFVIHFMKPFKNKDVVEDVPFILGQNPKMNIQITAKDQVFTKMAAQIILPKGDGAMYMQISIVFVFLLSYYLYD